MSDQLTWGELKEIVNKVASDDTPINYIDISGGYLPPRSRDISASVSEGELSVSD